MTSDRELQRREIQSSASAGNRPREYQLLPANSDFAKAAGRYIAHAKLLARGWTASCELPLLFPEMKVVAPRLVTHYFANAGNPDEGILRAKAQALSREKVRKSLGTSIIGTGFRQVIETGRANAVAAPESESRESFADAQNDKPHLASHFGSWWVGLDVTR